MNFFKRETNIPGIGAIPWGTHICLFYQSWQDVLDVLAPYFSAGLENNELCLWMVSSPSLVDEAIAALKCTVARFEEYEKAGQMLVVASGEWNHGCTRKKPAVSAYINKALSCGFHGLRLACNCLAEESGNKSDTCFGGQSAGRDNVIAVHAYPRGRFDAVGIMEVVKKHRLALVQNARKWEVLESSAARTAREELRWSEERLHSVFSNMSEGFAYHRIVLDDEGNPCDYIFLEVNDAFEKLTGLRGADIIGKRATAVLPGIENDPTDWIGRYGRVARGEGSVSFESHAEALDRWYAVSAFSSQKDFFAVIFSDISERKRMQADLQRHAEELAAANKELESFSYSVSHDLRAPLRTMKGFSNILLEDYVKVLDEDGKGFLRRIAASADKMNSLIEDMLGLARISRESMSKQCIELGPVAASIIHELRQSEPRRSVEASIGGELCAFADPRLLRIALSNLIANAWKYSSRNPAAHIEVGSTTIEGERVFFVRDNGAGFDMGLAKKLFQPFQRLHSDSQFPGTGIGLAIVHKVIQRHGGRIWATSEEGKGATFYFMLPAATAERHERENDA